MPHTSRSKKAIRNMSKKMIWTSKKVRFETLKYKIGEIDMETEVPITEPGKAYIKAIHGSIGTV